MRDWLARNYGHLVVILVNLIVISATILWLRRPPAGGIEILVPSPAPPPPPTLVPTPALIAVYVSGAVAESDVYVLPEGSRVKQAVDAAGGFAADAARERVNLAAPLADGSQIHVPRIGEMAPPVADVPPALSRAQPAVPAGRVNINTATLAELEALPGIGAILAQRIIDDRTDRGPFRSPDDIKRVRGIGDALYEQIQELITVR